MLSVKSRVAERGVDAQARAFVLDKLQEKGFTPLIRVMRHSAFEQALLGADRVREMERLMSAWAEGEPDAVYVRGDLFNFETHTFFLIFGDEGAAERLRAGVVHTADTEEPERKLEAFCRNVEDAVGVTTQGGGDDDEAEPDAGAAKDFVWRSGEVAAPESFARFASTAAGDAGETQVGGHRAETAERLRAVEALEDADARKLLRRLSEAKAEGRTSEMLLGAGRGGEALPESLVVRLAGAGLVRRELLISCRKAGRSLFRLPSADALAVMTASGAVCSECGAAVADERAEELATPTPIASVMLKDGAWLVSRMRSVLVELGVPEGEIAARTATGEADALLMANVAGEPFLFVLRDGEFAIPHARHAIDVEADAEVSYFVIVATGKVHEDARARLREHQKRRARTGAELELILVEGVDAAAGELRQAIERVTQKALAAELYELDSGLGMSAGHLVAARFRLTQKPVALQDLAASAAGALAGSLREF